MDIVNKISTIKEVLAAHPKNNKKNVSLYIEKLNNLKKTNQQNINKIYELLNRLNMKYEDLTINPHTSEIKEKISSLENDLFFLREQNSSYEKVGLDKVIYQLSRYYKGNLSDVNNYIRQCLEIFYRVGVDLEIKDFDYSPKVSIYMNEILNSSNDEIVSQKFDELYWKCPNLILHIKLNFQYLYFKNKKKFDKYVESEKKRILEGKSLEELSRAYNDLFKQYSNILNYDPYLILSKFKNNELKLSDFTHEKIERIYSIFQEPNEKLYNPLFSNLLNSALEYKNYLKYKFIIDDIKVIFNEKDKYKKASALKLKEISKEEKKLFKLNWKYNRCKTDEQRESYDLEINTCIVNLDKLYNEYDKDYFNEQVSLIIKNISTFEDVLELVHSNFNYMLSIFKKENEEISLTELNEKIYDLGKFILNPYQLLMTNLNITEEYNIPVIISDKYKLTELNVGPELLDENNLDGLINQIEQINNYHYFTNSEISLKEIDLFLKACDVISDYNKSNKYN